MNYMVIGSGGPALGASDDMMDIIEDYVLPGFEALRKLQADRKILAGGVPVSERAVAFIIDVSSNEELDQIMRSLPLWGILEWQVTPLQSFEGRAFLDRKLLQQAKKR